MIELTGSFNRAKVFTDTIEEKAISQITEICSQEFAKDSKIRIMPDVHAGKGCTIGTTMTINDKVCPNLVGVDIGCGVLTAELLVKDVDFKVLDNFIRTKIPNGRNIRNVKHERSSDIDLRELKCYKHVDIERALLSIGTLGGGNHFIEVNRSERYKTLYLSIHSGSRCLGKQVAEYYQNLAYKKLSSDNKKQELINKLKSEGKESLIQEELNKLKTFKVDKDLAYLEGEDFINYLHDINIVQKYAFLNKLCILIDISEILNVKLNDLILTVHNYIDTDKMILRKGAISAYKDQFIAIPMNMRDGILLCKGKGNPDWNYSAPHGAGRLMSRTKAKASIPLQEFKESMNKVWTTSVNENTIDESPMAYKSMEDIIKNIKDTVEIIDILKPVYNFKCSN